ncbi:MAG: hypothetical protein AB7Q29_19545 [Vicinamibacterales bacterium]
MSSLITLVVLGVAFSTFRDGLVLNEVATHVADSSQNLRAGANLIVRDIMQAGRDLPIGGIGIPSGDNATAVKRPAPPGKSFTFDNETASTLPSISSGAGLGPVVDGRPTDMITLLVDDPFMTDLALQPSSNQGNVPKLSADGSYFDVATQTSWLTANADEGIAPVKAGDLIYFAAASGNTLQTVTSVSGSRVNFAANDPFNLNQRGAEAGSITHLLGAPMTARRVWMYSYYVHVDGSGLPRLMRAINFDAPRALAGVIEDLTFTYDLVDGVVNPTAVSSLPYTVDGNTYSANQIRKVNVHIGVRSEDKSGPMSDYVRSHVSTTVSVRNLAYVDRYK